MLLTILLVLLIVSLFGGVWGNRGGRTYGYVSWSPFGVLALICLFLFLNGNLRTNWGGWPRGRVTVHDRR